MKSNLIAISFLLTSTIVLCQNKLNINVGDTLYYVGNQLIIKPSTSFAIYKGQNKEGKYLDFYGTSKKNGNAWLTSKVITKTIKKLKKHGKQINFYENGNKRSEGNYIEGAKRGLWKFYFKKGALKITREYVGKGKLTVNRIVDAWDFDGNQTVTDGTGFFYKYDFGDDSYIQKGMLENSRKTGKWEGRMPYGKYYEETYKKGTLKKGVSWDVRGKKFKYKELDSRASYKGGQIGLRKFFAKNMNVVIPKKDGYEDKKHRHFILFKIGIDGEISDIKIWVKGERNPYVIREIKRVFDLMKPWKPGKLRGQLVSTKFTLPLTIRY